MNDLKIQMEGELFEDVQMARVFEDGKAFVDYRPKSDPLAILQTYQAIKQQPQFDLADFIDETFALITPPPPVSTGRTHTMRDHIREMWQHLYREPDPPQPNSTLIPLPFPYVVPGGRFREIYYWDSYFTALGLIADGHLNWVESLIANFAHLISVYGHIPNGNRLYYLSRSQPPFFCQLLQLLEQYSGFQAVQPYLLHLKTEYAYWMQGATNLTAGANAHVVCLASGKPLNRFYGGDDTPRPEAFWQDREVVGGEQEHHETFNHLRAAAESGWDFSTRWMDPTANWNLATTRTNDLAPIDLNCLLYNMEMQLAEWLSRFEQADAERYRVSAEKRRETIQATCWRDGWFYDYNWQTEQTTNIPTLAGVYPLYFGIATAEQAAQVAQKIESDFLRPGGVVTTLNRSGQQWDAPNGWAPLQWMTVQGLRRYGHETLAREIASRFVQLANRVYKNTGKMMEKYDVCDLSRTAGGGEYPNQDGFGWTNGVVAAFCDQFDLSV